MGKKKNKNIIIGLTILIIGVTTISYDYINSKINFAYDHMNAKLIDNSELVISDDIENNTTSIIELENAELSQTVETTVITQTSNETAPAITYNYIGYLEIPALNIKKGFLEIGNKYNTVNKNVTVLKESDMPDVTNGNFILASHSGNSSVAFFTNLWKLKKGDVAYVTYKGKKYAYQIVDIYNQPKVGSLTVYTEKNKSHLTLITCTKDNKTAQTVYIAELTSIE